MLVSPEKVKREERRHVSGDESHGRRMSGGKRAFAPTAFDVVECRRQLAINHTFRSQGNRSPIDLRLEEIPHFNARLGANPRRERHRGVRFHFDNTTTSPFQMTTQLRKKRVLLQVPKTEGVNGTVAKLIKNRLYDACAKTCAECHNFAMVIGR
jgi:hypothetical protein